MINFNDELGLNDPFNTGEVHPHLRIQQRNARQSITILSGIPTNDLKSMCKEVKKKLCCSGTVKDDTIHFSGDQRKKIVEYLVAKNIAKVENIKIHGY